MHFIISVPPRLSDRRIITKRENEELSLVMSKPGSSLAFPFPNFTWTGPDGAELVNSTGREYGYPSIFIGSVQPPDTGNYTLTATNDHGTASASFSLNVLCEYLSTLCVNSLLASPHLQLFNVVTVHVLYHMIVYSGHSICVPLKYSGSLELAPSTTLVRCTLTCTMHVGYSSGRRSISASLSL